MSDDVEFVLMLKNILSAIGVFTFVMGLLLVLYADYKKIEELLAKDLGGIKKKVVPALEKPNNSFHNWLLDRRILSGILLIVASLFVLFSLRSA